MPRDADTPVFGKTIEAYRSYRPRYPQEIFDDIFQAVGPERNLAVDLGAGTGLATASLCPHFAQVIAVEPDPIMAAELEGLAPNVSIRGEAAEDVEFAPGSVDAVIAATAFHWMRRDAVTASVASWLRPGGVFGVFWYDLAHVEDAAVQALVASENAERWDAHRSARLKERGADEAAVRTCDAFISVEVRRVAHQVDFTPEALSGHLASTSYGAAYAGTTGDGDAYWRAFTARIDAVKAGDMITIDFNPTFILAQRA